MTPTKEAANQADPPEKAAMGRAQFVLENEDETLVVRLDRQGFRRLLQTLERLAASGEPQDFGKSGRPLRKHKAVSRKDVSIKKLAFILDQGSAS